MHSSRDVVAVGIWEPDSSKRAAAQTSGAFDGAHWFATAHELLADASIVGVAIEGRNHESLPMAEAAIQAGKHLWFDKPAGDDWQAFARLMDEAARRGLHVQMGYMFRYNTGFALLAEHARSGCLGRLFAVRAHMSTNVDLKERTEQARHRGGILYDLGGHMIDQIVWLFGRPTSVQTVLRNAATPELPTYADNTLAVFEFEAALGVLDIAAMEPRPTARRFEVYGTRGSAIVEPFDPARTLRLALEAPCGGHAAGEHVIQPPLVPRQELYERELAAFVSVVRDGAPANRPREHELLVQETLLRATGAV